MYSHLPPIARLVERAERDMSGTENRMGVVKEMGGLKWECAGVRVNVWDEGNGWGEDSECV